MGSYLFHFACLLFQRICQIRNDHLVYIKNANFSCQTHYRRPAILRFWNDIIWFTLTIMKMEQDVEIYRLVVRDSPIASLKFLTLRIVVKIRSFNVLENFLTFIILYSEKVALMLLKCAQIKIINFANLYLDNRSKLQVGKPEADLQPTY